MSRANAIEVFIAGLRSQAAKVREGCLPSDAVKLAEMVLSCDLLSEDEIVDAIKMLPPGAYRVQTTSADSSAYERKRALALAIATSGLSDVETIQAFMAGVAAAHPGMRVRVQFDSMLRAKAAPVACPVCQKSVVGRCANCAKAGRIPKRSAAKPKRGAR